MSSPTTEIAVAFVVREKFSWALASLRRLYAIAGAPFTLYFVEGFYPPAVLAEIDAFLAGKDNVVRIQAGRFLYPNEALNLVIERFTEPWLCLLQNDVMISGGILAQFLKSARALDCGLLMPATLDVEQGAPALHRETDAAWDIVETAGRAAVVVVDEPEIRHGCMATWQFEKHCLFMSGAAARAVWPLPPLNTREHIDLAMRLKRGGFTGYLDPLAQAMYVPTPPMPLRDFECDYFRFRWDMLRARQSHDYVRETWHIDELQDAMRFCADQNRALTPQAVLRNYTAVSELAPWPEQFALSGLQASRV